MAVRLRPLPSSLSKPPRIGLREDVGLSLFLLRKKRHDISRSAARKGIFQSKQQRPLLFTRRHQQRLPPLAKSKEMYMVKTSQFMRRLVEEVVLAVPGAPGADPVRAIVLFCLRQCHHRDSAAEVLSCLEMRRRVIQLARKARSLVARNRQLRAALQPQPQLNCIRLLERYLPVLMLPIPTSSTSTSSSSSTTAGSIAGRYTSTSLEDKLQPQLNHIRLFTRYLVPALEISPTFVTHEIPQLVEDEEQHSATTTSGRSSNSIPHAPRIEHSLVGADHIRLSTRYLVSMVGETFLHGSSQHSSACFARREGLSLHVHGHQSRFLARYSTHRSWQHPTSVDEPSAAELPRQIADAHLLRIDGDNLRHSLPRYSVHQGNY